MDASRIVYSDHGLSFWECSDVPLKPHEIERAFKIRMKLEGILRPSEKCDDNIQQATRTFQNEIFVVKLGEYTAHVRMPTQLTRAVGPFSGDEDVSTVRVTEHNGFLVLSNADLDPCEIGEAFEKWEKAKQIAKRHENITENSQEAVRTPQNATFVITEEKSLEWTMWPLVVTLIPVALGVLVFLCTCTKGRILVTLNVNRTMECREL